LQHLKLDHDGDGVADQTISGTAEHPFWEANAQRWIAMSDLRTGQRLRLISGTQGYILANQRQNAPPGETFTTYNFEVENFHTYFVGESGIWVHNSGEFCDRLMSAFIHFLSKTPNDELAAYRTMRKRLPDLKNNQKSEAAVIEEMLEQMNAKDKKTSLNLGSGKNTLDESINIDLNNDNKKNITDAVDMTADANKLPLKNDLVDEVVTMNPRGFDVTDLAVTSKIKPGGIIEVVGHPSSNLFVKRIRDAINDGTLGQLGLELVSDFRQLEPRFVGRPYTDSAGNLFGPGQLAALRQVTLRKKL